MSGYLALAGIILTFLTALLAWLQSLRNHGQIKQVHLLVNSNLTAVMDKLGVETAHSDLMAGQMKDAGMPVPAREKTLVQRDPPPNDDQKPA